MILTMTKYHENLLRYSPLSLLFVVRIFSSLETNMVPKIPNETFFRITRYLCSQSLGILVSIFSLFFSSDWWLSRISVDRPRMKKMRWGYDIPQLKSSTTVCHEIMAWMKRFSLSAVSPFLFFLFFMFISTSGFSLYQIKVSLTYFFFFFVLSTVCHSFPCVFSLAGQQSRWGRLQDPTEACWRGTCGSGEFQSRRSPGCRWR